jgi:hypothetical protein
MKKQFFFAAVAGWGVLFLKQVALAAIPTVTTTSALLNGSATGFDAGGTVSANGGASVTARGVCWNSTGSPTVADGKTLDGTGAGTFSGPYKGSRAFL